MPVTVLPAEDADMDRIFEIASLAFARNEPVWDAMFQYHWTPAGRKAGGDRMRLTKNSDPHTTYLKAVDPTTGEILGMAKWNVWDNVVPDRSTIRGGDGPYWDDEDERAYYNNLIPVFVEKRNAAIERTKGNLVSLDILAVDPAHQRKKVGDALVKWGLEKADRLGVETVVESSFYGRGLYEKNGFVFQEGCVVKVPDMGARQPGAFAWLIRPAKAQS